MGVRPVLMVARTSRFMTLVMKEARKLTTIVPGVQGHVMG